MRFVDREQRERHLAEHILKPRPTCAFRRDIEQVQLAGAKPVLRLCPIAINRRQGRRLDPGRMGRADLVMHQRDQRRDDNRGARPRQCGDLIAERFPRPGRHDGEAMLARQHSIDHLTLDAAKAFKAKDFFENRFDRGHGTGLSCHAALRTWCGAHDVSEPVRCAALPVAVPTFRHRGRPWRSARHGCRVRRPVRHRVRQSHRHR